jgi:hypothetical protein
VASALKLSLVYKYPHYSSSLAKLDHLGVEQFVIARAQIISNNERAIERALASLQSLNQRFAMTYPQT